MSKGSGRRRITPGDGIKYDSETMMTNIEERGGSHTQSVKRDIVLGLRDGAPPTTNSWYGNSGKRWGGNGRKDDNRNWKSSTKGKQYEKNLGAKEAMKSHREIPAGVAARMREKSINAHIKRDASLSTYRAKRGRYKDNYVWKRPEPAPIKTGFALFESRVRTIQFLNGDFD